MNSLTKLVNLASRGQLPGFVASAFCSATSTALNKKKIGIRPIAVGRLFGALLPSALQKKQPLRRLNCLVQSSWELLSREVPRA